MQEVRIPPDRVRMLREGELPGGGEGKLGGDRIEGMGWVEVGLGGVLDGDLFVGWLRLRCKFLKKGGRWDC
jgi:hypothetical protein